MTGIKKSITTINVIRSVRVACASEAPGRRPVMSHRTNRSPRSELTVTTMGHEHKGPIRGGVKGGGLPFYYTCLYKVMPIRLEKCEEKLEFTVPLLQWESKSIILVVC